MINKEFYNALDEICDQRNIEKEELYRAFEKGMVNAYKKETGKKNVRVQFNEEKHEILFYECYNVVKDHDSINPDDPYSTPLSEARLIRKTAKVGDYFEVKKAITPKEFGRLAISSTKQTLTQEIKNIEREKSYAYFSERQDEMIEGTVISVNDKYVIFNLGYDTTASLPTDEIAQEDCHVGARVKLYLYKVEKTTKGPRVWVSRTDKNLIKRLLESHISEVKDGTIVIMGIAREPEDRSKVCVRSTNEDVDALGSCLGPKGKRIQDVINALGGEKIDLYEWSDDPKVLITNALKPAEIIGVIYDEKEKKAIAIVPDEDFSLAIGKNGQNVRLAVKSCGWKIDIKDVQTALKEELDF